MIGMERKHFKRNRALACLFNIVSYGIILQTIKNIIFLNQKNTYENIIIN